MSTINQKGQEMDIKVEVGSVDLTTQIGEHYTQVGEDDWATRPMTLGARVAQLLADEVMKGDDWRDLRRQVTDLRAEEVKRQLVPIVSDALAEQIQKTDSYGHPTGKPVHMAELVVQEVHKWLRDSNSNSYSGPSNLTQLVRTEVDRALKQELGTAIADEKAKVIAAVRASAADLIADAVRKGIGS